MHYFSKKSYCELCQNNTCSDVGKRHIHFMGSNQCTRFCSSGKPTPNSVMDILKNVSKNKLPLYKDIDNQLPRFIKAFKATDNSFQLFVEELANAVRFILHNYGLSRKIFSFNKVLTSDVARMRVDPATPYFAIDKLNQVKQYDCNSTGIAVLDEFYIQKFISVTNQTIQTPTLISDILLSLLEQFFTIENNNVLSLLQSTGAIAPIEEDQLNTANLVKARNYVTYGYSIVNPKLIVGEDVLEILLDNKEFTWKLNEKEEIEKGNIGRLLDMEVITEAQLPDDLRSLYSDTFYITNDPGVVVERKTPTGYNVSMRPQERTILIESIQAIGLSNLTNYYSAFIA